MSWGDATIYIQIKTTSPDEVTENDAEKQIDQENSIKNSFDSKSLE